VPPLGTERTSPAAAPNSYAAVTLFVERAQYADHHFEPTDSNLLVIGEICRRLDGIPLAIELVAARMHTMSLETLAHALQRRFPVVTVGDRTAPPRHQTMNSLIDWSFDLLSGNEQRLLETLSVFAGGCVLEAAAAVYADGPVDQPSVLQLLSSLVDKSLVVEEHGNPEPRYRLLQTTRDYASNKLTARGEGQIVARRHAIEFVRLAELLHADSLGIADERWATRVQHEMENWRLALLWTLEARNDIVLGQRLVGAMHDAWQICSLVEGRHWTREAMELVDEGTPALVKANVQYGCAMSAYFFDERDVALACFKPLIAVYQQLGERLHYARAQHFTGQTLVELGRISEGEALSRLSLEHARTLGNLRLIGVILASLGSTSSAVGDFSAARAYLSEAIDIYRKMGSDRYLAGCFYVLAEVESHVGNMERAVELAESAIAMLRSIGGSLWAIMQTLTNLVGYLISSDHWNQASAYARETLDLVEERGHYGGAFASILQHIAAIASLSSPMDADANVARIATAGRLLGYVDAHLGSLGFIREPNEGREYERLVAALTAALPNEDVARLRADGAAWTAAKAVEEATALLDRVPTGAGD
jgi:tetratricopeptide (TPR) repeat protein